MKSFLLPGLALAAAFAVPAGAQTALAPSTASVRLVPHTAIYDLELAGAARHTGIVSAKGRIVMSQSGGKCTGWSTATRMVVDYVFRRRGEKLTDMRNASWESPDGTILRYASTNYSDGRKTRELRLVAKRTGKDGAAAKVFFTRPKRREIDLPAKTLFPQLAMRETIAAALAGARSFRYRGYEGFEDGRARLISTVIGKMRRQKPGEGRFPALDGLRSWPVSFAYYHLAAKAGAPHGDFGLPEYELSFRLYENGVAGDVELRFTDFTLRGVLTKLDIRQPQTCE